MHLEFSPLAQIDLETIGDYIAEDSPANALRFVEGLRTQCEKITRAPSVYVARPEFADGLRSCAHGRYIIFFRLTTDVVRIVRILHSAMDVYSINLD
jgi:toxin ParE1/3/4